MSAEDRAFLEEVMTNGIINEGDRMKTILNQLVSYLDDIKSKSESASESECTPSPAPSADEIEILLQELQDIVEQIDYAMSFSAMGGLPFLIGCASQTNSIPTSIRAACLSVLATVCQNNPKVQYNMLELGNIPKLVDIYFAEYLTSTITTENEYGNDNGDGSSAIQAKALQAMSCCVRNHAIGEKIFCMNQEGRKMIESALGLYSHVSESASESELQPLPLPPPNATLRRKALFFLQALVTSDFADADRINLFTTSIQYVATRFLDPDMESNDVAVAADLQLREMTLSMLTRILDQKKSVNAVLDVHVKNYLVGLGVKRVLEMRALEAGEEKEMVEEELRLWELLIMELARGVRDEVNVNVDGDGAEEPLMLGSIPENDTGDSLAQ